MIRRRAAAEWRWARAISPGITIWMLATSVLLATPGSLGLVRRRTRRSACWVPTNSAARIACGRRSRQRHKYGTASLRGSMLMPPPIQAGVTPLHRLWKRTVAPLWQQDPQARLFLVMVDGCSYPVFLELLHALSQDS